MSLRRIATSLDVAPNALYTYFPDKSARLRAVVDRLVGEHAGDAFDGALPWRERIHAVALRLRAGLLRHPGAAGLILGAPMDGPQALLLGERLPDVLADAGLSPDEAARACYLIIVYLLGSVALEAAELDPTRPAPPERVAARRIGFDQVPEAAFPRTAAAAAIMSGSITTEQFVWGLDRVLDGLAPAGTAVPSGRRRHAGWCRWCRRRPG